MGRQPLLAGISVLSIAEQFPGPYATLLLADLGADVVVVERPGGGDPTRERAPEFHESLNRNKRSVALDLKHPEGRDAFLRLAGSADVVLEGFRPGVVERLGVGYAAVRGVNPDVVYVSISGFGQTGSLRDLPAHDLSLQAVAGLLHDRLGDRECGPAPWLAVGDLSAGTFAALAVLGGLVARDRTGEPSYVDVSMADGLVSWMTPFLFAAANGMALPGLPPRDPGYGIFPTADGGAICLSIAFEDWFWADLCDRAGIIEHATLTARARVERYEELQGLLADVFARRTRAEWEQVLGAGGVPFAPVLSLADVLAHPHVAERALVVEVPGRDGRDDRRHVRQPLQVLEVETTIGRHVPRVGEHTRQMLRDVGFTDDQISRLAARGVAGL